MTMEGLYYSAVPEPLAANSLRLSSFSFHVLPSSKNSFFQIGTVALSSSIAQCTACTQHQHDVAGGTRYCTISDLGLDPQGVGHSVAGGGAMNGLVGCRGVEAMLALLGHMACCGMRRCTRSPCTCAACWGRCCLVQPHVSNRLYRLLQ